MGHRTPQRRYGGLVWERGTGPRDAAAKRRDGIVRWRSTCGNYLVSNTGREYVGHNLAKYKARPIHDKTFERVVDRMIGPTRRHPVQWVWDLVVNVLQFFHRR